MWPSISTASRVQFPCCSLPSQTCMQRLWRTRLSVLLMMLSISMTAVQADPSGMTIEFRDHHKLVQSVRLDEFDTIAPVHILEIFEAHEKRTRAYKAYPARAVFDRIFGKRWRAAEEIVFVSKDGYQPSIPVEKFLTFDAYLAFASADGSPFMLDNLLQNEEMVDLGPLYLVWDNLQSPALRQEGASDMPYQLIAIELTTFATRFPRLVPPAGASPAAKRGFLHFRKHCLACHTINGEGGGKAPELNYPVSVTEYIRPEYLRRWLDEPASIRYNTTMPALAAETPQREQVIAEIITYLETMRTQKGIQNTLDTREMP